MGCENSPESTPAQLIDPALKSPQVIGSPIHTGDATVDGGRRLRGGRALVVTVQEDERAQRTRERTSDTKRGCVDKKKQNQPNLQVMWWWLHPSNQREPMPKSKTMTDGSGRRG